MRTGFRAIGVAVFAVLAAVGADDPQEIVRRAFVRHSHNEEVARMYTFLLRQEVRALDNGGKQRHRDCKTWDVTLLEGSPYSRLTQRDDKPLPPKEEAHQEAELRKSIEQRRKETPDQRQKRIRAWEQDRKAKEDELKEVPDAFQFRLLGEDALEGVAVWVIEATPRAGYKPKAKAAGYYAKLRGRMWISKSDYQVVKIEGETTDTIAIGAFLVRFQKGAHLQVEFARVNDEVWLPKHVGLNGAARFLLVKGMRVDADFAFSNYRKFSAESKVIPVGQQ
jgi:hypothetical protein